MPFTSKPITRRQFLGNSAAGIVASAGISSLAGAAPATGVTGANDQITIAVIGTGGRGNVVSRGFTREKNVKIKTLCDVDENCLPRSVRRIKEIAGYAPSTEYDLRKVNDDKDIDAVVIVTPNHWHALATIWACQAGKDVYVEKPCCHNLFEGRQMIKAARKYKRIVQVGFQNRSNQSIRKAMEFLHSGGIGDVYMARGMCFKPRDSIGTYPDEPVPAGVHYDMWLGPAPKRPFNQNRFKYKWHWHWDYGNGDIGNQGPHQFDLARFGMNKNEHPVRIQSMGGFYAFPDSAQETANTQIATYKYADGKILQFEVRGVYTNGDSAIPTDAPTDKQEDVKIGNLFFGTKGWMSLNGGAWKTYFGRKNEPGPSSQSKADEVADPTNLAGAGGGNHYANFLQAMKTRDYKSLTCDIKIGYMSTALPLMANISYRLGRELNFDGKAERFINDAEANTMLTRNYREPYVVRRRV